MKSSVVWVSSNFWPLLPALVGLVAIATMVLGCGAQTSQTPWPLVPQAQAKGRKANPKRPLNAASLVESSLRERGLRFGTDGSVKALYSYATQTHDRVSAQEARPGDLVFFDTSPTGNQCGGHVGLVQGFAPGGALKFRERREGEERVSVADPQRPGQRRDEDGRVINTFLRARKPNDPEGTRYYAGQMVCAVVRVSP
ncbi:MAG: NlpC/P60 family protein [Deltaproteobacteria bacterium]|nr:NlpC/P60 family protein [Deltaproteobacteria bacterium]